MLRDSVRHPGESDQESNLIFVPPGPDGLVDARARECNSRLSGCRHFVKKEKTDVHPFRLFCLNEFTSLINSISVIEFHLQTELKAYVRVSR